MKREKQCLLNAKSGRIPVIIPAKRFDAKLSQKKQITSSARHNFGGSEKSINKRSGSNTACSTRTCMSQYVLTNSKTPSVLNLIVLVIGVGHARARMLKPPFESRPNGRFQVEPSDLQRSTREPGKSRVGRFSSVVC